MTSRSDDNRDNEKSLSEQPASQGDKQGKSDPQLSELDGLKKGGKDPQVNSSDRARDERGNPD